MNTESRAIKNILLVEDDLRDVELTLTALEEHHLLMAAHSLWKPRMSQWVRSMSAVFLN